MPHIPYEPRTPRVAPQSTSAAPGMPAVGSELPKPAPQPRVTRRPAKRPAEVAQSPRQAYEGLPKISLADYRMDVDEVLRRMAGPDER